MPRALVTGGAGFIGSHVADKFLQEGFDVVIVDDLSNGKVDNVPQGAEFHRVDIRSREAADLVRGGRFDVLVHLAAQMDVRRSVDDPVFDADVNVSGSLNLLEAVRVSRPMPRVVFTSTGGAIYGNFAATPTQEGSSKEPGSPYAISKLAVENYLSFYANVHGVEAVTLRFGNVYGPRQDPHGEAGVVAIFCNRVLERRALTIFGDGMQTRDYTHVSDVVSAVWLGVNAILPPADRLDSRAFNVGTGAGSTVLDVAGHIQRTAGTALPLEFLPERHGETRMSVLCIDKARDVLGWQPAVSLPDGLAATYSWLAEQGNPSGARQR